MREKIGFYHYLVPAIFLIFLSLCYEFLALFGLVESAYYLVFFPFFEELFKFLYARNFLAKSRNIIIALGIWEFLIVKIPLMNFSNLNDAALIFIFSILPLIFHVSSAFVYSSKYNQYIPKSVFFIMLICHIFYNSINLITETELSFFIVSLIFSISPLVFFLFISKIGTGATTPE